MATSDEDTSHTIPDQLSPEDMLFPLQALTRGSDPDYLPTPAANYSSRDPVDTEHQGQTFWERLRPPALGRSGPVTMSPQPANTHVITVFTTRRVEQARWFAGMMASIAHTAYMILLLSIPLIYEAHSKRAFQTPSVERAMIPDTHHESSPASASFPQAGASSGRLVREYNGGGPVQDRTQGNRISDDQAKWETYLHILTRQWILFAAISAVLGSVVLGILEVPGVTGDPRTYTPAKLALVCTFASMGHGFLFLGYTPILRGPAVASKCIAELRTNSKGRWWNFWVLIAVPAVWMSWSFISFVGVLLSLIWLSSESNKVELSVGVNGAAVVVNCVSGLSFVSILLVVHGFWKLRGG